MNTGKVLRGIGVILYVAPACVQFAYTLLLWIYGPPLGIAMLLLAKRLWKKAELSSTEIVIHVILIAISMYLSITLLSEPFRM
ncbi:MAG TPA: hypothetical protein VJB98_03800 [Candidatus Paceibacterota bacterium]